MENLEEYQKQFYVKARKDEKWLQGFRLCFSVFMISSLILMLAFFIEIFEPEFSLQKVKYVAGFGFLIGIVIAIYYTIAIYYALPFAKVSEKKVLARYKKMVQNREIFLRSSYIKAQDDYNETKDAFEKALVEKETKKSELIEELKLIQQTKKYG